jgi:rubredoxin
MLKKYECQICGFIYDPEEGDPDASIEPGTSFNDLPDDWVCPIFGATKQEFAPID